jgi:hypothetical protein
MTKKLRLTLVVAGDLLREARAIAARRRTSVNALVRDFLKEVVAEESRILALERIRTFLEHPPVHLGGGHPARDELHER